VVRPAEEVLGRRAGAWRRAGRRRGEARPGRRAEPCGEVGLLQQAGPMRAVPEVSSRAEHRGAADGGPQGMAK
jgi:hypothetical protein